MVRGWNSVLGGLAVSAAVMGVFAPMQAHAEEDGAAANRHFYGPYVGAEIGFQSLVGGADANGTDVLAQETRAVGSGILGFRLQFDNRIVVGVEGSIGLTDGDLELNIPSQNAQFLYENDRQFTIGGTLGYASGADLRTLLFIYVNETSREFDVTINAPGGPFRQTDGQGILRFGVGLERQVRDAFHIRGTVGSGYADFDGPTFNDFETPIEASVAVIYQF